MRFFGALHARLTVWLRCLAIVRLVAAGLEKERFDPVGGRDFRFVAGPRRSPMDGGPRMAVEREVTAEAKANRKQRREEQRKIWTDNPGLDVVHPDAAGIDVGNGEHYVAIAPDKSSEPVRRFGCFTADLRDLARFLKEHGIVTVVMQSTGVYWIPLYDVLEEAGFEVYLVNARDTKNLPGRKSDVQESQWLLKLHTYGLLRNSFRPTSEIRVLRTYWRQRGEHVQTAGECVQRMQKSLTQMNLQLANVISDIMGRSAERRV